MGVSVGLLPVTGQNLPFFTTGGTSIWMTCMALGIVLSVSAKSVNSEQRSVNSEQGSEVSEQGSVNSEQGSEVSEQ